VKRRKRRGSRPETGRRIGAERAAAFQADAGTTSRRTVLAEAGSRAQSAEAMRDLGESPLGRSRTGHRTEGSPSGIEVKRDPIRLAGGKPGLEGASVPKACRDRRSFASRAAEGVAKASAGGTPIGTAEASAEAGSRGKARAPARAEPRKVGRARASAHARPADRIERACPCRDGKAPEGFGRRDADRDRGRFGRNGIERESQGFGPGGTSKDGSGASFGSRRNRRTGPDGLARKETERRPKASAVGMPIGTAEASAEAGSRATRGAPAPGGTRKASRKQTSVCPGTAEPDRTGSLVGLGGRKGSLLPAWTRPGRKEAQPPIGPGREEGSGFGRIRMTGASSTDGVPYGFGDGKRCAWPSGPRP
jgi:hypothetical protein